VLFRVDLVGGVAMYEQGFAIHNVNFHLIKLMDWPILKGVGAKAADGVTRAPDRLNRNVVAARRSVPVV